MAGADRYQLKHKVAIKSRARYFQQALSLSNSLWSFFISSEFGGCNMFIVLKF